MPAQFSKCISFGNAVSVPSHNVSVAPEFCYALARRPSGFSHLMHAKQPASLCFFANSRNWALVRAIQPGFLKTVSARLVRRRYYAHRKTIGKDRAQGSRQAGLKAATRVPSAGPSPCRGEPAASPWPIPSGSRWQAAELAGSPAKLSRCMGGGPNHLLIAPRTERLWTMQPSAS
jgi:hypothetical protein